MLSLFQAVSSIDPFLKFVLYETSFGVELIEMIFQLISFQHSNENLPFFNKIMLLCKKKVCYNLFKTLQKFSFLLYLNAILK